MNTLLDLTWKMLVRGGWAPALVFAVHVVAARSFRLYEVWPPADVPMHFCGGLALAYFVSRCFRALPRPAFHPSRVALLELVLVASLTVSAAAVWELAEFALDRTAGTNVQVSLANTMQDLALGILGAGAFLAFRARSLGAGLAELRALAAEWTAGLEPR